MEVRFGGGSLSTVIRLPDSQKVEAFPWFKYLLKLYPGIIGEVRARGRTQEVGVQIGLAGRECPGFVERSAVS